MIPFALKQAWFWLALVGLVQCWLLFIIFPGRRYGGFWGRMYYCTIVTLLEGIFCLGMIWHMNPASMPHAFCIAQVVSFSLGSYALTGLCASYSIANALAVFRPQSFNSGNAVLAWHPRYIPLVVVFPLAASITQIALLMTTNAVQPDLSDDLHCDATRPIWMRLIGYAGVPLVVSLPFLVISALTAYRLFRIARGRVSGGYSSDVYGSNPSVRSTQAYELQGNKRRNRAFRLTAFLPYPTLFSKSATALAESKTPASTHPASGCDRQEGPPHKHPFPPTDPLTGKAYSPSLEDRGGTPFSSLVLASRQLQSYDEPYSRDQPRNLTPPEHDAPRTKNSTPDSAYSGSMPVFAPNPSLSEKSTKSIVQETAGGVSLNGRMNGASDTHIGLALTIDESPADSRLVVNSDVDSDCIGLAVTTDEPDARTITPVMPSDVHHPRSSESVRRTLSSSRHPILPITSATPPPSPPGVPATSRPLHHEHQSSFVSSATMYSGLYLSDREDRELLPFSPGSATTFQSPMTPKDVGIDLVLDLDIQKHIHESKSNHPCDQMERMDPDWDYDGFGNETGVPVRTVKSRDPRERLGVYNPTPPTPSVTMLERRRQKLQRRDEERGGLTVLASAIWRMVLFQIAFFSVQLLASLSSILDVAHKTITPFGTQHVALLLAAWGPLFIFGHIPSSYRFWTRWQ